MAGVDASLYAHSRVHRAVVMKDHAGLRRILAALPRLADPGELRTEAESMREEEKADAIASVIDRRDVPHRDAPLHLAVKLGDVTATEMLMAAGADWSLQNERGWNALQEAICSREEGIAVAIVRHSQALAWAKWSRRLPRLVGAMRRMRDFYMEITFQFDSSVIPFISRIAPSDTYRIWKRGSKLRADMTLAGFDSFRVQRSDQTVLFLGDGSEDGKVPPGALCMISHKEKEVMNALDSAGCQATEAEVKQEVAAMSKTSVFRPGIDVMQAVLFPQLTWRRQERTEMVGPWKAKVYDMHNVTVSIKSRAVPGAISDGDGWVSSCRENEFENEDLDDILTDAERRQLEVALRSEDSSDLSRENGDAVFGQYEPREIPVEGMTGSGKGDGREERKGWFDGWRKKDARSEGQRKFVPPRSSLSVDEKVSDLLDDPPCTGQMKPGRHSVEIARGDEIQWGANPKASSMFSGSGNHHRDASHESEYKKGLRPVLWLSPDFPLKTEELLPLLDILSNKVKAVRRLRELLTTKLPLGTFPVKVAIPVVPTIRVLVTFTKFEELRAPSPAGEESPPSKTKASASSWFHRIRPPYLRAAASDGSSSRSESPPDPFVIPADYTWTRPESKTTKTPEKSQTRTRSRRNK